MYGVKIGLRHSGTRLLLLLCCAFLAQSCATRGGVVPYDRTDFAAPDAVIVPPPADGRIGPFDVVSISVVQLQDLSRDVQVDATGVVTLPLLGPIKAVGMTVQELRAEIATRLAANYVRNPDVSVTMKQPAIQTITVEGSVQQAGVFPITGDMTLLRAIALARGTTDGANPRRVVVFRMIKGQRNAAAFDLLAVRRAEAPDPQIYGNDVIVVDGSVLRAQFRDVISAVPLVSLFRPF